MMRMDRSAAMAWNRFMKAPRFASVDDYLAAQDSVKAATLRSIMDFILGRFPELESKISWNVPTIHRNGKYIIGFSVHKKHLTFSAFSPQVIADFQSRLGNFVVMKNCFQLPVDWEVDEALVSDLVRARLAELD